MKTFKLNSFFLLLVISAGLFLNSCTKNDEPLKPKYENFISNELKSEFSRQEAIANLIKLAPEAALMSGLIKNDVEVHKIIYKTIFQNKNIRASGLVCLPKSAGNYPVLSFQNGTNTLHSLAPTEVVNDNLFSIIESVASMGFIVVIPDYIGFGASSNLPHPYLHAKSTTQSILDMLRAVNEFSTDDKIVAKPSKDLFIFGYSQGGWATMLLQKSIEKDYSSEFNLIASSCAAGPYSIEYMNDFLNSQTDYPTPYFLTYVLNAYKAIGLFPNPLSDFIQEPFASIIPGLYDGNHPPDSINAALTTKMDSLLTPEYRTEFATNIKFAGLKSAFLTNSVTAWNISTPTHLYHGENDEVIPFSMSQTMLANFKSKGVHDSSIQLIPIPGASHLSAVFPTGSQTILWFLSLKK